MKFAKDYKYRHIPFCSRCAAHTKFTPVQNSRVVGAMTFDNPNSNIDPTLFATRTETKLCCNTCGSEMFKWYEQVELGDMYLTKKELQKEILDNIKNNRLKGGCTIFFTIPIIIMLAALIFFGWDTYLEIGHISCLVLFIVIALLFTIHGIGSIFRSNILTGRDLKIVENHNRVIKVGKGVNGETVLFHQETGEIEYKR